MWPLPQSPALPLWLRLLIKPKQGWFGSPVGLAGPPV